MSLINTVALMQASAMRNDAIYANMMNNQARLNLISGFNPSMNTDSLFQADKKLSLDSLRNQTLIKMADAFEKNHREKTKKAEGFDTFA